MSRALLCVLSLGTATALQTCPLNFVGNVKQFVVEQENGKNRRTVPAVERAMTAKEFYDFNSYSSHTGFEKAGTSNMFLYRDLNHPHHLSFFWIHGIDHPQGNQPESDVDALITGIPSGVTIAQSDDRTAEWDWTSSNKLGDITHNGGNIGGHWWFNQNTDGGALDGFPTNLNWEIKIQANFIRGIDTWSFHFGDGSLQQDMDMSEPVYLRPVVTSVDLGVAPYPQVAGAETFCTLVESITQEQLTYTFKWGDETPDTVVTGPAGHVTCASHDFCGPVSATCGGTAPRKVRVFVKKTGCVEMDRILADEKVDDVTCGNHEGVKVSIDKNLLTGHNVNGMDFSNNNAVLTRIPENMRDMQVHTPGTIPKGTAMTLTCCGSKNCEFIVSHYHCPPCSGKVNGGFPALLPLAGFESASCAPKWGLAEQKMVSYRVQVDAGTSLVLPETTEEATSFVIFSKIGEMADPWCQKAKKAGCGGPCPPTKCTCSI
eukprot:TRINITY_DN0_c0_g1_i9.p1 TRINITY_DN0_c0_g1~~TRINITY_DN0_c0_g1_i9.p1  ORF type:complete len:487 (+),score=182.16 TRINITY_DN0_c0_g1_i9:66-1526(+)